MKQYKRKRHNKNLQVTQKRQYQLSFNLNELFIEFLAISINFQEYSPEMHDISKKQKKGNVSGQDGITLTAISSRENSSPNNAPPAYDNYSVNNVANNEPPGYQR